jgi:hypothetical protein
MMGCQLGNLLSNQSGKNQFYITYLQVFCALEMVFEFFKIHIPNSNSYYTPGIFTLTLISLPQFLSLEM